VRKGALANSAKQSASGTVTLAMLYDAVAGLGDYAIPGRMAMVMSPATYWDILYLVRDEGVNFQDAVIIDGKIDTLLGCKVVVSSGVYTTLNNSGIFDDSTKTDTWIGVCNLDRIGVALGWEATYKLYEAPDFDGWAVQASVPVGTAALAAACNCIYYITA